MLKMLLQVKSRSGIIKNANCYRELWKNMRHFTDKNDFDKNMQTFMSILELKGYVLESDHVYAYSMRHNNAFEDAKDWLINHGYDGHLNSIGAYDKVAVYGLYDSDRITYEEMLEQLLKEAERQNNMI